MVCDYELAWQRLGEFVASKTQHGREGLLVEMQRIAAECQVPAGELSRLLRLYGVEVERVRSVSAETDPADGCASDEDSLLVGTAASRDIIGSERSHDGGSNGGSNGRSREG